MVFLVILAGGVVRMTQSGMGCPDWPRCFGKWIPPLNASELPPDFEKYLSKQDIDHTFNVWHTWIEYINRLLGALLGVFVFIHLILSIKFRKIKTPVFIASLFMFLTTGFQGFLGKLVVDSNLSVVKITIHMLVAILIAAIPLFILAQFKDKKIVVPKLFKQLALVCIVMCLLQVGLGTQVREEIDIISKGLSYEQRELWISGLDYWFYIHRSFSWIMLAVCGYLWWKNRSYEELGLISNVFFGLILIGLSSGLIMYFFDMPAIMQPIHLLTASGLCVSLLYYRMRIE